MRISDLTAAVVKDYCGISDEDSDTIINDVLLPAAKAYIRGFTGLTEEQCDEHDDLTTACMVLVNDMFTSRDYTLSSHRQVSPTVRTILSLYAVNYL
ncbi:MAG: phage gp6-like head-tail connector protein [Ruminococcus sp.]|nr:phage gp6-like head-tail connector protein [Ruminococcus sp.]